VTPHSPSQASVVDVSCCISLGFGDPLIRKQRRIKQYPPHTQKQHCVRIVSMRNVTHVVGWLTVTCSVPNVRPGGAPSRAAGSQKAVYVDPWPSEATGRLQLRAARSASVSPL